MHRFLSVFNPLFFAFLGSQGSSAELQNESRHRYQPSESQTNNASAWAQVGPIIQHDAVLASSIDFNDATGDLIVAYGYTNISSGNATTILFLTGGDTASAWTTIASHTPQFAQPYDDFAFRARDNTALYLGLRINEAYNISSVLRGGGGYDGFEGCWAFNGWVFDFEVYAEPGGAGDDIRLVASPDNATLQIATYNHTGYDQYPAADAWGPYTTVAAATNAVIDDVVVARGPSDTLFAAWTSVQPGSGPIDVTVAATTLSNTTQWQAYLTIKGSNQPSIAWAPWGDGGGGDGGSGMLCVSVAVDVAECSAGSAACVAVQCSGTTPSGTQGWLDLGQVLAGVDVDIAPGIAMVPIGANNTMLVVAAQSASNASTLLTASCVVTDTPTGPTAA